MKDFPHNQIVSAAIGVFDCVQGETLRRPDDVAAPAGAVIVSLEEYKLEREKA